MEEEKDETHIDNILSMLGAGEKKKDEEQGNPTGAGAGRGFVNPPVVDPNAPAPSLSMLPTSQQAQAYGAGIAQVSPDNKEAWLANKSAQTAKMQAAADLQNQKDILAGINAEQQAHLNDIQANHLNAIKAHAIKNDVLKNEVARAEQAHQDAVFEANLAQTHHFKLNPEASPIKPVQGPDLTAKPRGGIAGFNYAVTHGVPEPQAPYAGSASNVQQNFVPGTTEATNYANRSGLNALPYGEHGWWLTPEGQAAYAKLKEPEIQQAEQLTQAKAGAMSWHNTAQEQLKERAKELAAARKELLQHESNPPIQPAVKTPSQVPRIQQQGRVTSAEGNLAAAENTVKANPGPGPVAKFFEPALKLIGGPLGAYGMYKAALDMREHGINPENAGAMLESGLTGAAPFNPKIAPAAGGVGLANAINDIYQHGPSKENLFHAIGSGGMLASGRFPVTGALSQLPSIVNETNKYFAQHPNLLEKYNENPNP